MFEFDRTISSAVDTSGMPADEVEPPSPGELERMHRHAFGAAFDNPDRAAQ